MNAREAFGVWATGPWGDWVKPALFATAPPSAPVAPGTVSAAPDAQPSLDHLPDGREHTAIVLELRGADAVKAGLALAATGYRPVPVYNTTHGNKAVLDTERIASALVAGAQQLKEMRFKETAPPVFLLDAHRMPPGTPPSEGKFDNRWLVFPQDFPSATLLRSRGIDKAILVQEGDRVRDDLAHVLLRWQEGGISLSLASSKGDEPVRPLVVSKPPLYRRAWYRVLTALRLRRNSVGGFGAIVPIASSGGYG